jgi:hypothetical protein
MAAGAATREDCVHLGQRELLQRVVLMDVDRQGVHRHPDARGLVAELLLEGVDLAGLHLAAHGPELGRVLDQRRRGGRGALALDLDTHAGVDLPELLGPEGHQVVEGVGADGGEGARNAADPRVGRQLGIHLDDAGRARRSGGGRRRSFRRCRGRSRRLLRAVLRAAATRPEGDDRGQGHAQTCSLLPELESHRSPPHSQVLPGVFWGSGALRMRSRGRPSAPRAR